MVREMYEAVAAAAQQYEASGPGPNPTPGVLGWVPAAPCALLFQTITSLREAAAVHTHPMCYPIHATELLQAVA